MGWIDTLFRKQVPEESLGSYFDATTVSASPYSSGGQRPTMSELASRYGMLVHRCVSINASTAASIRPRLYVAGSSDRVMKAQGLNPKPIGQEAKAMLEGRMSVKPSNSVRRKAAAANGDITEITDHPFLNLFDDVNSWTEGYAWRESVYSDLQIFGRHFSLLVADNGAPTEMWRLLPQQVEVESGEGQFVSGFKYGSGANSVNYAVDDVFWCHLFDPLDPLGGMSPLEAWLRTVDAQFSNAAFVDYMFHHGGAPDYMLIAKQGIGKEQKRAFRSEFRRLFGRMVNRKETVAILSGDADLKPLQRPPRELQSVEHEQQMTTNLAIAFGVPKSLLTSDDVNLANAREGSITHARNTIWPMVNRFEDVVNQRMLPKWSDRLFIMHDSPIQEDRTIRIQERASQLGAGYSINEIRTADGMPVIEDERADEPLVAVNLAPALREEAEAGEVEVRSLDEVVVKEAQAEPEPEVLVDSFKGLLFQDGCDCELHKKATEDFGDASDGEGAFTDDLEKPIRLFLRGVLKSINRTLGKSLINKDRPIAPMDTVLFFEEVDFDGVRSLFGEIADDKLATIMFDGGSDALMELEQQYGFTGGVAFDINTDSAQNYFRRAKHRFEYGLTETLEKDTREKIAEHISRGDNVSTIAETIRERLATESGNWSEERAKRIARTETRFAVEEGKREAWKQSGVVEGKKFKLAPGGCKVCQAVAEDQKEKDDLLSIDGLMYAEGSELQYTDESGRTRWFKFNYTDVQGPPIHPNCRCTLVPKVADD